MKVTLNRAELTDILSKHFGVLVTEFTINKSGGSVLAEKLITLIGNRHEMNNPLKIAAIKDLRQFTIDCGEPVMALADAKGAIEQWPEFIGFVQKYNRLPKSGWGCYGDIVFK